MNKSNRSKEFLISEFWRYFKENGVYPLSKNMKVQVGYPSLRHYIKTWGSWFNFLKFIDILGENEWYKCDEDVLREYYEDGKKDIINEKLMIKREYGAITKKANSMGLMVKKDIKYKCKYSENYIKDSIMQEAINFYKINNRTPNKYESSYPKNAFNAHWTSYNDFLIECELPIIRNKIELQTKEDGIQFLIELKKELSRNPMVNDLLEYGLHKNWFSKKFGSWKNSLFAAGLINKKENMSIQDRVEASINGLKRLHREMGKLPIVQDYIEYQKQHKEMLTFSNFQARSGLTYCEMCKKYLGESRYNEKTKDILIDELLNVIQKNNKVPLAKELECYGLEHRNVYITVFNMPFNKILKSLEIEPAGHDPIYRTYDELLNDYYNLYVKLGRIPFSEDINECKEMASFPTYQSKIGTIFNICDLLDIDWRKHIIHVMNGNKSYYHLDKNGEICLSFREMVISNIFIENNIRANKEVYYKDVIKTDNTKRRFDWYLPDYDIYVEYFGLFEKGRLNDLTENYSKKSLDKIKLCAENNIKLIDLYPSEVRRNYTNMLKKFNKHNIILNVNNTIMEYKKSCS